MGAENAELWRQVKSIAADALEQPESERERWVRNACDEDPAKVSAVLRLLRFAEVLDELDTPEEGPLPAGEEGRFPLGTVLAARYRILGLLGHGGMGEVYRAHDLILNQAVALKFLSQTQVSEPALVRFRNEVRIARQVSHPNVCRVYDIGFVDQLPFLSMEYLDGEDLGSLLRRIGRLPQDKAIEFTRKICAGLSAAHDRGVLHRDLKPSNIMIDGRGQVRIADFGLAALAREIKPSDLRSGTPAYMSPEQKAGKEVTTRSDLYSLGLVLYEMFTGKCRADTKTNPASLVKELDPAIDRLILRCLDEDPRCRPSSALGVAMALPGGDPIAAALAAGEIPSPEMVAASREKEGFSARTALACFVGIVISVMFGAVFAGNTTILGREPVAFPPDALAFHAQEVLKQFGYSERPRQSLYGFFCCNWNALRESGQEYYLLSDRPAVGFWYRQHRSEFTPGISTDLPGSPGFTTYTSPANTEPGMIRLMLDVQGRLVLLEARPSESSNSATPPKAADWTALLSAAGFDPARLTPAVPQRIPPVAFDARMAWNGPAPSGGQLVQVEAASWQGRPVFFDVGGITQPREAAVTPGLPLSQIVGIVLLISLLAGSAWIARRNLRLGHGDRRGAAHVASALFVLHFVMWILFTTHVARPVEVLLFLTEVAFALTIGLSLWMIYLALEPYVRRNWPDSLISWTRLQTGRVRNPLVASHILAGITLAEAGLQVGVPLVQVLVSGPPAPPTPIAGFTSVYSLNSPAFAIAVLSAGAAFAIYVSVAFLFLIVLLRLLLRRLWLADLAGSILLGLFIVTPFPIRIFGAVLSYGYLLLVRRFGLLAIMAALTTFHFINAIPFSLTSWYASRSILIQLVPAAAAAWALWVILSDRTRSGLEPAM